MTLRKLRTMITVFTAMFFVVALGSTDVARGEDDPWTKFSKQLATVSQGGITFNLDDEKKSGWTVYYFNNKYSMQGNDSMTEEGYQKLKESEEWPGTYIVDLKEADQGILPWGRFLIYDKESESPMEYIASFDQDKLDFSTGTLPNMKTVDFYTISFKQGDVEGMEIPAPHIQMKGNFQDELIKMPHNYPGYIIRENYGHSKYMEAGGYAFSSWVDQDGRYMTYVSQVEKPLTLTPVFVNEDDDDNAAYFYQPWNDGKTPVSVTTAEGLLNELSDGTAHFVTIDGDITLNPDTCDTKRLYAYTYNNDEDEDFIIIHDGATLTIENLEMECSVNWERNDISLGGVTPITVQKGGKLELKNKGQISYGYVAVQKGGSVTVDSLSHLQCVSFFNHGKLELTAAAGQGEDRIYNNLECYSLFFNSKDGVIDNKGGHIYLHLEDNLWHCSGEYAYDLDGKKVYNDIGDMSQVSMRNNGKMTLSGKSHLSVQPNSNSVYQHDRGAQMPFINNGSLILSADASGFYEKYNCELEYGWLINNGTIGIKKPYGLYPYISSFSSQQGGGIKAFDAMITNNGEISMDIAGGTGIYLAGLFYDPTGNIGYEKGNVSYKEPQKGRLINNANAKIDIHTDKDSIGLFIGDKTYLENSGTITMGFAEGADKNRNVSMAVFQGWNEDDGVVKNNGTITNNGFIGHNRDGVAIQWEGNKWTGTGSEGLLTEGEENKEENGNGNENGKGGSDDSEEKLKLDNKPVGKKVEDRDGFKAEYCHGVPFWGKGKIDASYFGEITVTVDDKNYTVNKIKVNKKKKCFQVTGLANADKDIVKTVKKATKGANGLPFTQNKFYVKEDDTNVTVKEKKDGSIKSVKVNIAGKDYKAKKDEWEYDSNSSLVKVKVENLEGSWKKK